MKATEKVYETLLVDHPIPGVARLMLNRPDRYNAMTRTMFRELEEIAFALDEEHDLRVVIISGQGKAFCAGFDLDAADGLADLGAIGALDQQELAARGLVALRGLKVPVIAAVNGAASGGGFSLALAADIRLASPEAKFNAAFVKIGLSAGDLGVSWLLPRLIGPAHAAEICFTGRMVFAEEAEHLGLVNSVGESGAVMDDALALARQILSNSPAGVQLSKRAFNANLEVGSYAAALELENRGQVLLSRTVDMPEALAAFREKREPNFVGE